MSRYDILQGDASVMLATLEPESVQTCVTSPPYFGLRDYGVDGQIGLEPSPDEYVARLVEVMRGVRRALKPDGTLWLNLGDSYAGSWGARGRGDNTNAPRPDFEAKHGTDAPARNGFPAIGVKPKDLLMIPARVALALQMDGWWLRSAIVWHKPNPMPESVTDRPTSSYEMVFLLAKSERYYYDAEAISEPTIDGAREARPMPQKPSAEGTMLPEGARIRHGLGLSTLGGAAEMKNARNVWTIPTAPLALAHFAVMPPELARKCILAGSREGDTVLDCFNGAATTGVAALETFRNYVGIELNPDYIEISRKRLDPIACQPSLFEEVAA
jgi:DNA modification methylase